MAAEISRSEEGVADSSREAGAPAASMPTLPRRSPWGPLYRLRYLILITLGFGLTEWVLLRFGPLQAVVTAAVLSCAPLLLLLKSGIQSAKRLWLFVSFLCLVGSGTVWFLAGTEWALAAIGMAAVLTVLLKWRLNLRHVMVLVAVVAVFIDLFMIFGASIGLLLVSLAVPMMVATIYTVGVRRPAIEREALVSILEVAARSSLPMVASVEAFEAMCPPRYRDVVRDFLTCLKSGATLSQAARTVPRALPDESTSLVIFGQSEGVLAPALQQAVASRHNRRLLPTPNPASVGYPIVISLALLSATSYFLIYVGPRIVTISNEFGAVLPTPSQWLLTKLQPWGAGINNVKGEEFLVGLFAVVCVAALVGVTGWALWTHGLLTPTPGLWLERRRETAALLRGLSVALEAERPETGAVLQLIRSDISRWSLTRWSATFDLLRRGQPLPAALRSVGLIGRSHVAILESAQRAGNLPWAMRVVADGIERRAAYRVNALGHVMRLFGTILLGGLVAVVALAYFCPLVTLIMHAVESI